MSKGHSGFAGVIKGTLNGTEQKFYCIDLNHNVNPSSHPTYWDEGSTSSELTYILKKPNNKESYVLLIFSIVWMSLAFTYSLRLTDSRRSFLLYPSRKSIP